MIVTYAMHPFGFIFYRSGAVEIQVFMEHASWTMRPRCFIPTLYRVHIVFIYKVLRLLGFAIR